MLHINFHSVGEHLCFSFLRCPNELGVFSSVFLIQQISLTRQNKGFLAHAHFVILSYLASNVWDLVLLLLLLFKCSYPLAVFLFC